MIAASRRNAVPLAVASAVLAISFAVHAGQEPPGESLWQFLAALPGSNEAQQFYALLLGAVVGMIGHYVRAWATGGASGSLYAYMIKDSPQSSALAVLGVVAWCIGEVSTGLFVTSSGEFVGWGLVVMSGLKTGYAGDSLINKGAKS